jgi:hypothetical protein
VVVPEQIGFIMEDPRKPASTPNGASWDPYYWAAIHVVRHNDAILANAPWMDETILPVGARPLLPEERIPVLLTPVPNHLYGELMASPAQRKEAMRAVSFVVVQQYDRAPNSPGDPMTDLTAGLEPQWNCQQASPGWYRICQKQTEPAAK